jgi:uncharacterized protein
MLRMMLAVAALRPAAVGEFPHTECEVYGGSHHEPAFWSFGHRLPDHFGGGTRFGLASATVLTEACHLAPRTGRSREEPLKFLARGVLRLAFALGENHKEISSLMGRYSDIPMSLADACLVRMSELVTDSAVLTLDGDFRIYRRHKRQRVPLLIPPDV